MDMASMLSGRVGQAMQIQATIAIGHEARAAVVAALDDVKRNAGKR
jgi:hypothetical protein